MSGHHSKRVARLSPIQGSIEEPGVQAAAQEETWLPEMPAHALGLIERGPDESAQKQPSPVFAPLHGACCFRSS
jgi:hypothetical protein